MSYYVVLCHVGALSLGEKTARKNAILQVVHKVYHVLWNFRVKFLSVKPKGKGMSTDLVTKAPNTDNAKDIIPEITKAIGTSMRGLANSRPGLQIADSDEEEDKEEENEEEEEEEEEVVVEKASSTSTTSKTTGKRSVATIAMSSHNTCDTQAWATGNSGARNTLLMASLEKQKQASNNVCSVCLIIYVILCCFMSYYVVLCHIMWFYVILCCFISFHVISFAHVLFMLFYVIIC